jgi:hypothetical protein
MKYIITNEDTSVCWLWKENGKKRLFSKEGQAIIVYKARPIFAFRKWSVVRLLKKDFYEHARGSFLNICDNASCVNPNHWKRPFMC